MDPHSLRTLEKFFTTFNVTNLGEGDPVVGANTLAAMCFVLAGVARPGSGIETKNGRLFRMNTSVLVSGAASTGRVVDEVIMEVGLRQNHFSQHLQRDRECMEQARLQPLNRSLDGSPVERPSEIPCSEIPASRDDLFGRPEDEWARMLAQPPVEKKDPLSGGSKFFVAAARPKDLEKRLSGLHRGQPLVHLNISRPSDLAEFGDTVGALLDGCHVEANGETVHGQVLVTDPLKILDEAAKNTDEGTAWLGRTVWLSDHDAGPEVPKDAAWENMDPAGSLSQRFREALGRGLAKRLGGDKMKPQINTADLAKAQHRWTGFLKEMEKSLPGITGAARNLLVTLSFGLLELSLAKGRKPFDLTVIAGEHSPCTDWKKLELTIDDVEAFARFLVLRMANARATILYSGEMARRRTQIRRIFQKLGEQPITARTVYQHLNLKADECFECLKWLETSNLACQSDSGWARVDGAQLSFTGHPILALEV